MTNTYAVTVTKPTTAACGEGFCHRDVRILSRTPLSCRDRGTPPTCEGVLHDAGESFEHLDRLEQTPQRWIASPEQPIVERSLGWIIRVAPDPPTLVGNEKLQHRAPVTGGCVTECRRDDVSLALAGLVRGEMIRKEPPSLPATLA